MGGFYTEKDKKAWDLSTCATMGLYNGEGARKSMDFPLHEEGKLALGLFLMFAGRAYEKPESREQVILLATYFIDLLCSEPDRFLVERLVRDRVVPVPQEPVHRPSRPVCGDCRCANCNFWRQEQTANLAVELATEKVKYDREKAKNHAHPGWWRWMQDCTCGTCTEYNESIKSINAQIVTDFRGSNNDLFGGEFAPYVRQEDSLKVVDHPSITHDTEQFAKHLRGGMIPSNFGAEEPSATPPLEESASQGSVTTSTLTANDIVKLVRAEYAKARDESVQGAVPAEQENGDNTEFYKRELDRAKREESKTPNWEKHIALQSFDQTKRKESTIKEDWTVEVRVLTKSGKVRTSTKFKCDENLVTGGLKDFGSAMYNATQSTETIRFSDIGKYFLRIMERIAIENAKEQ